MEPCRLRTNHRSNVLIDERDASLECGVASSIEVHLRGHIIATRTSRRGLRTPGSVVLLRPHIGKGDAGEARGAHSRFLRPLCGVVVISYKPRGANPTDNFVCVDGLFKDQTHFIESECAWAAPTCDPLAYSPELISQILESYLPKNWALVVQGLSAIVPELEGSRARRIVVLEADPDRESYVK